MDDPLDLYAHLMSELQEKPPGARWVMNGEWWDEVRQMAAGMPYPAPLPGFGPFVLLGLPVEVRDDGGVPHLSVS